MIDTEFASAWRAGPARPRALPDRVPGLAGMTRRDRLRRVRLRRRAAPTRVGGNRTKTSSMEGISASTEEQTASMEEITAMAVKLGSMAEELKENLTIE